MSSWGVMLVLLMVPTFDLVQAIVDQWYLSVCLSIGLANGIAKLIHYKVVVFPMPRISAWLTLDSVP